VVNVSSLPRTEGHAELTSCEFHRRHTSAAGLAAVGRGGAGAGGAGAGAAPAGAAAGAAGAGAAAAGTTAPVVGGVAAAAGAAGQRPAWRFQQRQLQPSVNEFKFKKEKSLRRNRRLFSF